MSVQHDGKGKPIGIHRLLWDLKTKLQQALYAMDDNLARIGGKIGSMVFCESCEGYHSPFDVKPSDDSESWICVKCIELATIDAKMAKQQAESDKFFTLANERWQKIQAQQALIKKIVLCFPEAFPPGSDSLRFDIPAYIIDELRQAAKEGE